LREVCPALPGDARRLPLRRFSSGQRRYCLRSPERHVRRQCAGGIYCGKPPLNLSTSRKLLSGRSCGYAYVDKF